MKRRAHYRRRPLWPHHHLLRLLRWHHPRHLRRRLPHLRRPRGPIGVKHHQGDRPSTVALSKASPEEAFFLRLRVGLPRTPACRAVISTGDVLHPA